MAEPKSREVGDSRRGFLSATLGALAAAVGAIVALPVLSYARPRPPRVRREGRFDPRAMPPGGGLLIDLGGRPLLVLRSAAPGAAAGDYSAVWGRCPHLGCAVGWDAEAGEITCPCHGGRFDRAGRVLGGPPKSDLVPAEVSFEVLGPTAVLVTEGGAS